MDINKLISICILIPSYNEGENLKELLPTLKKLNMDILVVDDGSNDGTLDAAREAGVMTISHRKNLGKGQALQSGFNFALAKNYDAVITMDADLQHDAGDIPNFIKACEENGADIILGDRMLETASMPLLRFWTNKITSRIISLLTGCPMRDTQSGFRLIRRGVLEEVELSTSRFDTESEVLIKALRKGFRIFSVPIRTIYFDDSDSKIKPFVDTLRFARLIFKAVFVWRN